MIVLKRTLNELQERFDLLQEMFTDLVKDYLIQQKKLEKLEKENKRLEKNLKETVDMKNKTYNELIESELEKSELGNDKKKKKKGKKDLNNKK